MWKSLGCSTNGTPQILHKSVTRRTNKKPQNGVPFCGFFASAEAKARYRAICLLILNANRLRNTASFCAAYRF